jgi:beta-phosphoglucomutase-like phosphatase (HAD superfamily)
MNLYTFPGSTLEGFIFHADEVLFDGNQIKPNVADVLAYLKENGVQMSVYSQMHTEELTAALEKNGIRENFDLIMGSDMLDKQDPYTDATRKSEECFQLDHVFKYVVICQSEAVVDAAVEEGIRSIVVTDGQDIGARLEEKCWKIIENLEGLYYRYERSRKFAK